MHYVHGMFHTVCRHCLTLVQGTEDAICSACGSERVISHEELTGLCIAHVDCDSFFASVEKRDRPELADKPVAVGGGSGRGVLTTACYVARQYGLRSAMPGFKARQLCPDVVFLKPDIEKYKTASQQIRAIFHRYTDTLQPLSLDEAYLDLSDGVRKDPRPPAILLAELATAVETEVGVTVSIGLAPNKFLAKLASDLDKPRGFSVIGAAEAAERLAPMPVRSIMGVGPATEERLKAAGFLTIGDLQNVPEQELTARLGKMGQRVAHYRFGLDDRPVKTDRKVKSISAETTLETNTRDRQALLGHLQRLADRLEQRMQAKSRAGGSVFVKLKSADFQITSRQRVARHPALTASDIMGHAAALLDRAMQPGTAYRLVGLGVSELVELQDGQLPRQRLAEEQQTLDLFDD
ncbi:MAG: DNA polymerase IV [Alphaproteobacteria bacterium]